MYTLTISKIPGNKYGDCSYTFTDGNVIENKTYCSYPTFVIKVGVENIAWDLSDKRQVTMKSRVEKMIAGSSKKEAITTPEPAKCEEAKVEVASDNKPLQEVNAEDPHIRIFTTDDGDTITVIA